MPNSEEVVSRTELREIEQSRMSALHMNPTARCLLEQVLYDIESAPSIAPPDGAHRCKNCARCMSQRYCSKFRCSTIANGFCHCWAPRPEYDKRAN